MKILTRYCPFIFLGLVLITNGCKKDASIPTLTTADVTEIKQTSALGGGAITSDGGDPVICHGLCWSVQQSPTITDGKSTDSSNIGSFSGVLIGLVPNTTYHVRAFATNGTGTGYGNEVTFTSETSGTVTDIDGNSYYTITLGTQEWMIENLKVTHYNNGDPIPNITGDTAWSNLTTGAYCDFNNLPANGTAYGRLYNYYTIHDSRGVAPAGWHIPNNEDWNLLNDYLSNNGFEFKGVSNEIGKSMASQTGWLENTSEGTVGNDPLSNNTSGFTGLASGYRYYDGTFTYMGAYTFWWSNSDVSKEITWYRCLSKYWSILYKDFTINTTGMSLRCVKD
jgi:uncharacterized protein (TIGR02145 family)